MSEEIKKDVEKNEIKNNKKKKKKVRRKGTPNILVYLIAVAVMCACIYYSYQLYALLASYTFLPAKYIKYALYGLVGFNAFFGLIAFLPNINNLNKILQTIITGALAFALCQACIIVPAYKGKMERAFTEIPTEGELKINIYTLADNDDCQDIKDISGKTIGWATDIDKEYQEYALKVFSNELKGEEIQTTDYESIYDLVEALYSGESEFIMCNESYAEIISNNEDFLDFDEKTKVVYSCMQQITLEYDGNAVGNIAGEPFIIMVGGNDTWSYDSINKATQAGRTDVNIVAVVNPNTKQILLVTIPRDTYVALWGNHNCMDKLTHATVYSVSCWMDAVNDLLDIDINYYIRINFASIINVVNAVGGIDIYNPDSFTATCWSDSKHNEKVHFEIGNLHLTGEEALGYVRERYSLPGGDRDRNRHQAIVIKGLIEKVTSVAVLSKIGDLFDAIEGTFFTDLTMDQIYALVQMQLNDMAMWDIQTYAVSGAGGMYHSYAMGRDLSIIIPNSTTVKTAKGYIAQIMNNEVLNIE